MIKCQECQHKNPKESHYCLNCGSKLIGKKNKKFIYLGVFLLVLSVSGLALKTTVFKDKAKDTKMVEAIENNPQNTTSDEKIEEKIIVDYDLEPWEEAIEIVEEEIVTTENSSPTVDEVYPLRGCPGTVINIEGVYLDDGLVGIELNGLAMPIYNIDQHRVQGILTKAMTSGPINLIYDDQTIEAAYFQMTETLKRSLIDVLVPVSNEPLVYETEEVRLTIPPGAISEARQLTIEVYENQDHVFHLAEFIHPGKVYSINLEDQKSFEVPLTIEFFQTNPLEGAEPLAMTYDENSLQWSPMVSQKTDMNTVLIQTNHLTDFWYDLWYEKVTSPDGFFTVYYKKTDSFSADGYSDTSALATRIGQVMDIARKQYDSLTGNTLASGQVVLLHSDYNRNGGLYSPASGIIQLPTSYTSSLGVDTTAAHELFHLYQNLDMNMFTMSKNKWIIEASAEYVSHRLAFPSQSYVPKIWKGAGPEVTMTHLNEVQEYAMAAFIDYLLTIEKKEFKYLYKALLKAPDDQTLAFINFFKESNQNFLMPVAYELFWRHITTEKNPISITDPSALFSQLKSLNTNGSNLTFKYTTAEEDTQQFIKITPYKMHPNVPIRHVKVTSMVNQDQPATAYGLQLLSVPNQDIGQIRVAGGLVWDKVTNPYDANTSKIYPLEANDLLLLAVQGNGKDDLVTTRVREVNVKCKPEKIEEMVIGEVQIFKFIFSNIFEEAKELLVVVDYGDGDTKEKKYSNVTKVGIQAKHVYRDIEDIKFKASLYDVTGGKKELISELTIPVNSDKEVKITANRTYFKENETLQFKTNIQNENYRYVWSFGDADDTTIQGKYEASFVYTEKGSYTVSVNIFDSTDKLIGTGNLNLNCYTEDDGTDSPLQRKIILSNKDPVVGDKISFSTNIYDSDHIYEWMFNGVTLNYTGQETDFGYVYTEKGNVVLLFVKDKAGNQIDFLEYSFDAKKAKYEWVLTDTQMRNASKVEDGFGSFYSATVTDGLFEGAENYKDKYTLHSKLTYPSFGKNYKGGETIELPLNMVITNIDDLKNGDNNSAFFNSLTFHVTSKKEVLSIDGTRKDDGHTSTQIVRDNGLMVALTQGYAFDTDGPDYTDVILRVSFNEVYLLNPGQEKQVLSITFHFGKFEDTDAQLTYVFESRRSN